MKRPSNTTKPTAGFSLVEMMTAVAVFSMVMVLVFQMLEKTTATWKISKDSVAEFKDSRTAFETITRRLSQATLNTYWQIEKTRGQPALPGVADKPVRMSELHFVSGPAKDIIDTTGGPRGAGPRMSHCMFFQAPTGVTYATLNNAYRYTAFQNLLNSWGYFVEFNSDAGDRPAYLNSLKNPPPPRVRFRLMEFLQPGEGNMIYRNASQMLKFVDDSPKAIWGKVQTYEWFKNPTSFGINFPGNYPSAGGGDVVDSRNVRVVAENVIALIVLPTNSADPNRKGRLAPNYLYDSRAWLNAAQANPLLQARSRNQLPPIVEVVMIAVDESAIKRMNNQLGITKADDYSKYPFLSKLDNLFRNADLMERDLAELSETLRQPTGNPKIPIQFRVFRSTVRIRESRWGGAGADSQLEEGPL